MASVGHRGSQISSRSFQAVFKTVVHVAEIEVWLEQETTDAIFQAQSLFPELLHALIGVFWRQ